jgi:hypothetical protein
MRRLVSLAAVLAVGTSSVARAQEVFTRWETGLFQSPRANQEPTNGQMTMDMAAATCPGTFGADSIALVVGADSTYAVFGGWSKYEAGGGMWDKQNYFRLRGPDTLVARVVRLVCSSLSESVQALAESRQRFFSFDATEAIPTEANRLREGQHVFAWSGGKLDTLIRVRADTLLVLTTAALAKRAEEIRALPALQRVTVDSSQFEPHIRVTGIDVLYEGREENSFSIRSWIDKATRRVTHQLYVVNYYGGSGWEFWQSARGQDARPLEFTRISQDVVSCSKYGCSHSEHFGIGLSDALLRQHRTGGFAMKIYSKAGSTAVLQLTPDQIDVQLRAIAALQPANATKRRAAPATKAPARPTNTPGTRRAASRSLACAHPSSERPRSVMAAFTARCTSLS